MKTPRSKFLIAVTLLTIICGFLHGIWNQQAPPNMKMHDGFWLLGIFAVGVTGFHLFLLKVSKGSGAAVVRYFMASTVFKFLFYILVLVVFLLFSTDNKTALILHFLFYYLVFTILEVSMLYKEMAKKTGSS